MEVELKNMRLKVESGMALPVFLIMDIKYWRKGFPFRPIG